MKIYLIFSEQGHRTSLRTVAVHICWYGLEITSFNHLSEYLTSRNTINSNTNFNNIRQELADFVLIRRSKVDLVVQETALGRAEPTPYALIQGGHQKKTVSPAWQSAVEKRFPKLSFFGKIASWWCLRNRQWSVGPRQDMVCLPDWLILPGTRDGSFSRYIWCGLVSQPGCVVIRSYLCFIFPSDSEACGKRKYGNFGCNKRRVRRYLVFLFPLMPHDVRHDFRLLHCVFNLQTS